MNTDVIEANKILDDIFIYSEYGDMEPCKLEVKNNPFSWEFCPNNDDEWIFMLNRFSYLEKLNRASRITKDSVYINKGKDLIFSWIKSVLLVDSKMTRTLDTGIRIFHFINFYVENENMFNSNEKSTLFISLKDQINYLLNNYIDKYDASNWGSIQMSSIYIYSMLIEDNMLELYSVKKLKEQLNIQILDDDMHWEKSMTYHNEVLLWLLNASCYEKKFNKPSMFESEISRMIKTTIECSDFDNMQMNNGDSDVVSINPILDYYKEIFGDKKFEVVLKNTEDSKYYFSNGIYIEKKNNSIIQTYCTPMSSSHTNADITHFNYINKNGQRVVDPGRFTYMESEERVYYKSQISHNCVILDNKPTVEITESWGYGYYPSVRPIYYKTLNENTYIELGYFDENNSSDFTRKIVHLKDGGLIILDSVKCKGKHSASMHLKIKNLDMNKIQTNWNLSEKEGKYSPTYNEEESIDTLNLRFEFENELHRYIIFGNDIKPVSIFQNEKKLTDNKVYSFKIKNAEDESLEYCILYNSEISSGLKVNHIEGISFYGRSVIINKSKDIINRYRFR